MGSPLPSVDASELRAPANGAIEESASGLDRERDDVALLARRILDAAASEESTNSESTGRELAALGRGVVPLLFDWLVERVSAPNKPAPGRVDESVLRAAYCASNRAWVRDDLEARLVESETDKPTRAAALQVLGWVGLAGDVPLLETAVGPVSEGQALDDGLRASLEAALDQISVRDPETAEVVAARAAELPLDLAWTYARVLGKTGSPSGLALLGEILDHRPDLDLVVVPEIGRLGEMFPYAVDERTRAALCRQLALDAPPQSLREVVQALGRLEDYASLEPLLELLGHPEASVQEASLASIRAITGRDLGPDSRLWKEWVEEQQLWFSTRSNALFHDLETGTLAEVTNALQELAARRYNRDLIALQIAPSIEGQGSVIRQRVCLALAQLGSGEAIPTLIRCLDDEDAGVRTTAHSALRSITRDDFPADARVWLRAYPSVD